MKFKFKHIIATFALAGVMAIGVGAAINTQPKASNVEADTTWIVGSTLFFDAPDWWTENSAWSAAYFFNNSTSTNKWVAMSRNAFTNNDIFYCNVPEGSWPNVIFVRMQSGKIIDDGWNAKYYNQTGDLSFESGKDLYTYEDKWSSLASSYTWQVAYGVGGEWSQTYTHNLSYKNDADGAQFYTTSLTLNNTHQLQIKRVSPEGWFGSQFFENGGAVGSYLSKGSGNNNVTVLNGGTFEFYVKMSNCSVWTQVSSSTLADTWASGFVTGLDCAAPYNVAPSNWGTYANSYGDLAKGAKDILYGANASNASGATNVEKAAFMYDMCVAKYSSCAANQFMVDSHDTPRARASFVNPLNIVSSISSSSAVAVVIAVTVISLTTIGGYIYLRRRKAN